MKMNHKADVAPAQSGQHTPTPWLLTDRTEVWSNGPHWMVADCSHHWSNSELSICEANAAFIVQACNAHEKLVEALRNMLRDCTCPLGGEKADRWHATCESARAALALVEGK